MATTTIKTTYSLDVETVRTLDAMARHWNVSKSEALRRAIRAAGHDLGEGDALRAWDAFQRSMNLDPEALSRWQDDADAERKAWSERLERSRR